MKVSVTAFQKKRIFRGFVCSSYTKIGAKKESKNRLAQKHRILPFFSCFILFRDYLIPGFTPALHSEA
jgi:hypothetical protein